jgi:hypothetical protein
MTDDGDELLGTTQETLEDHIDAALTNATDEDARFHLRHAKQLLVDLRTATENGHAAVSADEECV